MIPAPNHTIFRNDKITPAWKIYESEVEILLSIRLMGLSIDDKIR